MKRSAQFRSLPTYLHSYMKFISVAILTLTDSFNSPFNPETSQCDHRNRKFEARLVMERFIHSKRGRTGEKEKLHCDVGDVHHIVLPW